MSQAHPKGPSVIERLAAYASAESFARLPEDTVRAARRAILDTIGVMLAGAREDTAVRARTLIAHRRGHEELALEAGDRVVTRESLPNRFSEVTVRLTDGRTLVKRVDQAKGQPRNPLTDADLEVKFRDAAGRVLSADRVDALLAAVQELETAADVRVVARLLSGGAFESEQQLSSGRAMRSGRRRGRPLPRGSSWTT